MPRVRWYSCIEEYWYNTFDAPYGYSLPPLRITQTYKDVRENFFHFKELPFHDKEIFDYENLHLLGELPFSDQGPDEELELYKEFFFHEVLAIEGQIDYLKRDI
ncbi:hypothetical protein FIBSPDRAFT_881238 [Athelia psychrophila]|uniref:Uncharacterized protein n=1 Tax=Athelia psychrophila TaxID=1759441 RepID=A0A166XGE6_9AGAM|nr:hypothetical protein FIBSPDRAFT_881238 [Fibularhizoctonia sp. CBS 109695]